MHNQESAEKERCPVSYFSEISRLMVHAQFWDSFKSKIFASPKLFFSKTTGQGLFLQFSFMILHHRKCLEKPGYSVSFPCMSFFGLLSDFWKINTPRVSRRKLVVGLRPSCAHSKSSKVRNRRSSWKVALFLQIYVLFLLHWILFFTTINKTIFVCWLLVSALADCSRKCRFDDPV